MARNYLMFEASVDAQMKGVTHTRIRACAFAFKQERKEDFAKAFDALRRAGIIVDEGYDAFFARAQAELKSRDLIK
jgi:hypothetical protein